LLFASLLLLDRTEAPGNSYDPREVRHRSRSPPASRAGLHGAPADFGYALPPFEKQNRFSWPRG